MNIEVNKVCKIAKNSLCVCPLDLMPPFMSYSLCTAIFYCKLPFHRTPQMQLYSNVFMLIQTFAPFIFRQSCVLQLSHRAFSVTNQQTAVDRPQSTLLHPHRLQTHYFHCSLCLQITTETEVYTTYSVCLSRLNFWYVCTLLLLLGLWCQH